MSDRTTLAWTVLPVLPLALAFALLGLLDHGTHGLKGHLPGSDALHGTGLDLRFFNGMATYGAAALFHVAACLAVVAVMLARIRALPEPERRAALTVAGGSLALVAAMSLIVRFEAFDGALNFAYRYVCDVVRSADVAAHMMPDDCYDGPLSRFAWMALLPYATGMIAAATASGLASTAFRPVEAGPPEAVAADLADRAARVEQAFQALAFVLVTATVSLVAFYRLPLVLIDDTVSHTLMRGYGQGLTLIWGVTFTLTLAAIFGPGKAVLRRSVAKVADGVAGLPDSLLPEALMSQTTRRKIAGIVATLAPLLIGGAGSVLEQLAVSL